MLPPSFLSPLSWFCKDANTEAGRTPARSRKPPPRKRPHNFGMVRHDDASPVQHRNPTKTQRGTKGLAWEAKSRRRRRRWRLSTLAPSLPLLFSLLTLFQGQEVVASPNGVVSRNRAHQRAASIAVLNGIARPTGSSKKEMRSDPLVSFLFITCFASRYRGLFSIAQVWWHLHCIRIYSRMLFCHLYPLLFLCCSSF